MAMQEQFCEQCGAANPPAARFCQYCATALPFKHTTGTLPEQTLLNGRYQLDTHIGQGGMGAVYKAIDTRFNNRPIAIKEMSKAGLSDTRIAEAESAFEHEARLLADLLHPNLPRIYDHFSENERSYLVMDFIEGQTLEEYMESAGGHPLPLEQVIDWGEQLCNVLSYLHNHQPPIIFRDLKPSNVMISASGHVFLIDFGIARIFKPGQSHDTIALGSPGFAAPEQYGKTQSTPRSDIYSLGALLHCLLTGADPSEQPFFFKPASQLNPTVPTELETLLQQMVDMNTERRPASAQDVLKTLRLVDLQRINGTLSQPISQKMPSVGTPIPVRVLPDTRHLLQNAYELYTQKRTKEALAAYDQAIQVDDQNAQVWQGRGLTLALNRQHYEALKSFERALQLDSSLVTSLNGKGTALSILHRNQEALEVFDRAISLEPDNPISWNGKGATHSALGQAEQALTAFDVAIHFDPHMAQAWGNKGLVLRERKRYAEALQAFEQALSYDQNNASHWHGRGLTLYEMGRLREAHQAFLEALNRDARCVPALYGLGNVYYAQHKLKSALESYDRALKSDPKFVKALHKRGIVLGDLGRLDAALDSYERALRIDPRYDSAWNGKGRILLQMERAQEALNAYDRALRLNPNAQAWNGKGNAHYQLRDYLTALQAYDQALRFNPTMVTALHNKSLVLKQLRRYEEALAAAEAATRLAPNDPDNWQRKVDALKGLRRRRDARIAEAEVARLRGEV